MEPIATSGVRRPEGFLGLGTFGSTVVLILTGIESPEMLLGKDSY